MEEGALLVSNTTTTTTTASSGSGSRSSISPTTNLLLLEDQKEDEENLFTMMDVGTGTGVVSAMMLRSGRVDRVVAVDSNPCAIRCAKDNLRRLQLFEKCRIIHLDHDNNNQVFPKPYANNYYHRNEDCYADLIICNPPWIPGKPDSLLDMAVYDPDSIFLRTFLNEVQDHFKTNESEAWLVISDLAERLELRERNEVEQMIDDGNLIIVHVAEASVQQQQQQQPTKKDGQRKKKLLSDEYQRISEARAAEVTRLYRLRKKPS